MADFGAGSGRWAHFFLEHASELWLVEPGKESFSVLQQRFGKNPKVHLHYFLCYLYYALENKPPVYRLIWKASNTVRVGISKLPYRPRRIVCEIIAATAYLPLARLSKVATKFGMSSANIPLHHYQDMSFYVMRNDAYDRFGTSLEQRFTKKQISEMVSEVGFDIATLEFSAVEPFWTFAVCKPT